MIFMSSFWQKLNNLFLIPGMKLRENTVDNEV